MFNLVSAISVVQAYTVLAGLGLALPPALLAGASGLWSVVFGALAVGLWRLKQWARLGTLAAMTLYLAQIWAERLLFGRSDYARVSAPFYAVAHLLLLLFVWGLLWRGRVRRAFSA
ncbi:MAG: hypothetical protein ABI847_01680 [Anaerolineales bacterium]